MLPLGGCLLSGDKPDPALDIPQAYDGGPRNPALAEAAVPTLDWWRGFRSKELTEVIEEARQANLDIAAAVAGLDEADGHIRTFAQAVSQYTARSACPNDDEVVAVRCHGG